MSKYLFILTAIILMNTGYSQCEGDANLDDIVNILDVVSIVNHILNTDLLDGEGLQNSDTNSDGGIDVIDIIIPISLSFKIAITAVAAFSIWCSPLRLGLTKLILLFL